MRGNDPDNSRDMNEIYRRHAQTVYRFLLSQCRDADLAEELTAETFYQAYVHIGQFRGECRVETWLCQIAKHLYWDELKRRRRHPEISVEALAQAGEEPPDTGQLPEISLVRRESYVSIHKAIHSLREPYREIFLLRTLSELSFREIGEIFDRTENWARVTYYRAKVMLAERLEEE